MSSTARPRRIAPCLADPAPAAVPRGRRPRPGPADVLDGARCPVCRAPLVARMTRAGPGFPCLCPGRVFC
jgi:hypothetical protein